MESFCFGIYQLRQGIDIGRFELRQGPIVKDLRRQLMLRGKLREGVFIRGVAGLRFAQRLQAERFEEHRGQLFGRADIEFTAGQTVNAAYHLLQLTL